MTVRIAATPRRVDAQIDPRDRFKLHAMTRAVLADRPSFKAIPARVDGHPVAIFTQRGRPHPAGRERLVLRGGPVELALDTADREPLEALLRETA